MKHLALYMKHNDSVQDNGNVAIVCMGNEFRGDDGVGMVVGRSLRSITDIPVVMAGECPENSIGEIAGLNPFVILFVDAMDFGGEPGEIKYWQDSSGYQYDISTHASSGMLFSILKSLTDADIITCGIQPKSLTPGSFLSPEILDNITSISENILGFIDTLVTPKRGKEE